MIRPPMGRDYVGDEEGENAVNDYEVEGDGSDGEVQLLDPRCSAGRTQPATEDVNGSLGPPVYQPLAPRPGERGSAQSEIPVAFTYMLDRPDNSQGQIIMRLTPIPVLVPSPPCKNREYHTLHPLPFFPLGTRGFRMRY